MEFSFMRRAGTAALLLATCCAGSGAHADDGSFVVSFDGKFGAEVRSTATLADIGVDIYPGAVLQRDGDESGQATVGLWGKSSGFKLAVVKLASADEMNSVANFYWTALGRFGKVVDCSFENDSQRHDKRAGPEELHCDKDSPDPGGRLFKVGTPHDQRIVELAPKGSGTRFNIVHLVTRSD
jgi:hypothetical protein